MEHFPPGKKTGNPLDRKEIFPDTFDSQVGLFEGDAHLKVSLEAQHVQLPPRAVPQSVMPALKEELDKIEREGIIRPCSKTTDWVHNLVVVVKKNGTLRLCLDTGNLNRYLTRNVHCTASWEDAQHSYTNGQFFSTPRGDTGRSSLTKKARFLQRLTLHSRNTVSYVYQLGSRCPQRSFASKWIASCQAFLEHFRAQTMLKYKDLAP